MALDLNYRWFRSLLWPDAACSSAAPANFFVSLRLGENYTRPPSLQAALKMLCDEGLNVACLDYFDPLLVKARDHFF